MSHDWPCRELQGSRSDGKVYFRVVPIKHSPYLVSIIHITYFSEFTFTGFVCELTGILSYGGIRIKSLQIIGKWNIEYCFQSPVVMLPATLWFLKIESIWLKVKVYTCVCVHGCKCSHTCTCTHVLTMHVHAHTCVCTQHTLILSFHDIPGDGKLFY